MTVSKIRCLAHFAILAGLGLVAESRALAQDPVGPRAPATYRAEVPAYRGLDSNLYMQTSAEYRACCFQAYNLATLRLKQALAESRESVDRLAIVMDLDETVFDNAGFQAMEVRSNLAYDQRLWDLWEEKFSDQVGLIPGAKDFILAANKAGVNVVYLSNRNERFRDHTKKALQRLGIPARDEKFLKLSTDTSDKTSRRQAVEKDYTVVLYIGDNLRDFDEQFKSPKIDKKTPDELEAAIKTRKDRVDATRPNWGDKWIILPNPAYGEWTKPLGLGKSDLDRMVPQVDDKK